MADQPHTLQTDSDRLREVLEEIQKEFDRAIRDYEPSGYVEWLRHLLLLGGVDLDA